MAHKRLLRYLGGATLSLAQLLYQEGWGSRRECAQLVKCGRATGEEWYHQWSGAIYQIDGVEYTASKTLLIALNKPFGYECSAKPTHHPSVLELFPEPYLRRGLQPIGRLDVETEGLLLFTDDGELNHRLSHPKHHLPKTYFLETNQAWSDAEIIKLQEGVELRQDGWVRALSVVRRGELAIELVIEQGLYHQVRRMAAALGKTCTRLIRLGYGPWNLAALYLQSGEWTHLELTD